MTGLSPLGAAQITTVSYLMGTGQLASLSPGPLHLAPPQNIF